MSSVYDEELAKAVEKLDLKSTAIRITSRPSKAAVQGLCDLADDVVILYYRMINAEKRRVAAEACQRRSGTEPKGLHFGEARPAFE